MNKHDAAHTAISGWLEWEMIPSTHYLDLLFCLLFHMLHHVTDDFTGARPPQAIAEKV